MVSLTLKVILHVAENDSKYRDVAPLISSIVTLLWFYLRSQVSLKRTPSGLSLSVRVFFFFYIYFLT